MKTNGLGMLMCWKCSNVIMEVSTIDTGLIKGECREMVGCKLSDKIKSYEQANEKRPCLNPCSIKGI